MLEKSRNFAHAPEVAKIYIWYGFQKWVWQNGSTAPPIHFQRVRLELRFTYMYENRYTHVTHQYLPKSLLEQNPKPNRKLLFLINSSNFVSFLRFSGLIL